MGISDSIGSLFSSAKRSIVDPKGFVTDDLLGGTGLVPTDRYQQQIDLAKEQVAPSNANAQELVGRALANAAAASGYAGPQTVTAQQIEAPTIAGPANINKGDYVNMAPTQAQSVDATGRMSRAQTVDIAPTQKAMVDGVDTNIRASKLGDAAQTGAVTVGSVQGDPLAEALRAKQIQAAENIANGPSSVKSTMQAGQADALHDALAMAATARGDERAGAMREAILASEQGGLAASLKAAALGAQEDQARRVAAASALGDIRSQDVSVSQFRQKLEADRNALQAQIDAETARGNTAAVNALKAKQADLDMQAQTASMQGGLAQQQTMSTLAQKNAELEAARASGNAAAINAAEAEYAKARNAAAEASAARQTATNVTNTALGYQQQENNLNRGAQIEQQNITNTQATRTKNAENQLAANTANAGNALNASGQNAGNQLAAQQLRTTGTSQAIQAGTGANNTQAQNAGTVVDANKSASDAQAKQQAGVMGAAGGVIAAVASDERVKSEISPIGSGGPALDEMEERQRRNKFSETQLRDTSAAFEGMARSPSLTPSEHNKDWAKFYGEHASEGFDDMMAAYALKKAAERSPTVAYSDERVKREVDQMDSQDVQDWAAHIQPITYYYKPGYGDGGKRPQIGLSAQQVEQSGPVGEMMVSRDPEGMRKLNYTETNLVLGKAAFDRATEARDLARALAAAVNGGPPPEREDMPELGPALALAASRAERRREAR